MTSLGGSPLGGSPFGGSPLPPPALPPTGLVHAWDDRTQIPTSDMTRWPAVSGINAGNYGTDYDYQNALAAHWQMHRAAIYSHHIFLTSTRPERRRPAELPRSSDYYRERDKDEMREREERATRERREVERRALRVEARRCAWDDYVNGRMKVPAPCKRRWWRIWD
jgi:hypothetical protein